MIRYAWLAVVLASCGRPAASASPAPSESLNAVEPSAARAAPQASGAQAPPSPPPSPPPSATAERPEVTSTKSARCRSDDDCALRGEHHCCGTCPVAPLTAVSASAEELARKKESAHCVREDHDCQSFRCRPVPPGCQMRAVCAGGWCEPALSKACDG